MLQSVFAFIFSGHPNDAKELINIFKISLETFFLLAVLEYNFIHFNQESWVSTCKVIEESFGNRSYKFLKNQSKIRNHIFMDG